MFIAIQVLLGMFEKDAQMGEAKVHRLLRPAIFCDDLWGERGRKEMFQFSERLTL